MEITDIDKIPLAKPPYDDGVDDSNLKRPSSLPKVGKGIIELKNQLDYHATSERTKSILRGFLLEGPEDDFKTTTNSNAKSKDQSSLELSYSQRYKLDIAGSGSTEEKILAEAQEGILSLFGSILSVIEGKKSPVSAKFIVRSCWPNARPGATPANTDCKGIILAALYILSSKFNNCGDDSAGAQLSLPQLPLIRAVQEFDDLEKRAYEKCMPTPQGTEHSSSESSTPCWSLSDSVFRRKLHLLENIFMSSTSSWKWVGREYACPRLTKKEDEKFLMFKGSLPPSSASRARKSSSNASTGKTKTTKAKTQTGTDTSKKRKKPASPRVEEATNTKRSLTSEATTNTQQSPQLQTESLQISMAADDEE